MNSLIDSLNMWGGRFADFAMPILWQSSVLIAVVFAFDFLLRRKVRAAIRYSLWFAVFLKLLLPPTLALPTGAAWWLRSRPALPVAHHTRMMTVNYTEPVDVYVPPAAPIAPVTPPAPKLLRDGWMLSVASAFSVLLAVWVLMRWRQITRIVNRTTAASVEIDAMLSEARHLAGLRRNVALRVTAEAMSPAVCGLFRPVILLPQSLIEKLTTSQLRAVLLHELIHLRRGDVWVNCAQTLLQIVYWWHPLLWIANARVRRVREEAVDDAVMCALNAEADVYAPTLLEVAKLAFARPLASLGLVGILESRSALRHRIERLLNFRTPRRAGVSAVSVICLAAFTALAVPMGEPPAQSATATDELAGEKLISYRAKVDPDVFTRNVLARAEESMHRTNDDLDVILVSILDGFNVDCTGDRAIHFNPATGEVTAQNSGEALQVLDEVVKELNLKGGEHVLNPPHGLKQVLIEAQFYLIDPTHTTMQFNTVTFHQRDGTTPWLELSPTNVESLQQQLSDQGLKPISSPRIQTAHGIAAELSIGDATNSIQLKCDPSVHDGMVTLTVLARTTGEYAPQGKSWPDVGGNTNCAIFDRLTLTNGGTALFHPKPAGADIGLVVLLTARILEPATNKVPLSGDLPGVRPLYRSPANAPTTSAPDSDLRTYTFRLDLETLTARLKKFAEGHQMTGITSNPAILTDFLANAGVDTYSSGSFFYREENGRANLTLHTTRDGLRKAAEALGLNWPTEQALNQGKSIDMEKLQQKSTAHYDHYKTNTEASSPHLSTKEISQLVQDGKLLYQLGKIDEAEPKLQAALAKDPNNQAAKYYMNLIKQARVLRKNDSIGGARARNVPGPGPRSDTIRVSDSEGKLPVPNPYAHTNIHTNPQRQRIYEKLNTITFDKIAFLDLPLSQVTRTLAEQTHRRDIDQQGINFILNQTKPPVATNGQPAAAANSQTENVDLAAVTISLDPGLRNARLLDVLEAITKSADHPISYSILDYGIEFSLKGAEQVQLHTRTFRVDPNTFYTGMQNVITIAAGKSQNPLSNPSSANANASHSRTEIQQAVIGFFAAVGVNLAAPKSVFFNDRQGTLTVHATDDDLELIEQAINTLNIAPPEVTMKARFFEINDEDMFKPGFEWFLEMMAKNGTNASGLAGILTEPQFRAVLKNIKQRKGADLLNEGEVTTLSGRPANFQVIDMDTNQTAGDPTNIAFGKSVDVVPYVTADGYTIQLTVTPTITERIEYPAPGTFVPTIQSGNGGVPLTGPLPLPRVRVRQVVVSCTVWDGQTSVILLQPYKPHGRNTVVFVTTTIIDPSGNRKNSDESLIFTQNAVPRQPVDK